jgi:hypothetical protein
MDITRIKRLILTFDFFLGVGFIAGLVDCVMKLFYNKSRHFVKGGWNCRQFFFAAVARAGLDKLSREASTICSRLQKRKRKNEKNNIR